MSDTVIRDPRAVKIKRALLSVSNKDGIEEFARDLEGYGVEILSTGGTAKLLKDAGIAVKDVSDHTGFPEIMDGRVKTLHPTIHGGLLARRDKDDHVKAMEENGIGDIDLLIVNLYPFVEAMQSGGDYDHCIENIDIGGPAMIRAAAKNHDLSPLSQIRRIISAYKTISREMTAVLLIKPANNWPRRRLR